jgi:hypothetical protein
MHIGSAFAVSKSVTYANGINLKMIIGIEGDWVPFARP